MLIICAKVKHPKHTAPAIILAWLPPFTTIPYAITINLVVFGWLQVTIVSVKPPVVIKTAFFYRRQTHEPVCSGHNFPFSMFFLQERIKTPPALLKELLTVMHVQLSGLKNCR